MPSCSIKQCGARKSKVWPDLTVHKFPVNEALKKKWLSVIGPENINTKNKVWYICSLHFDESAFNRTLDVMRLRDGAVPSPSLMPRPTSAPETSPDTTIPKTTSRTVSCEKQEHEGMMCELQGLVPQGLVPDGLLRAIDDMLRPSESIVLLVSGSEPGGSQQVAPGGTPQPTTQSQESASLGHDSQDSQGSQADQSSQSSKGSQAESPRQGGRAGQATRGRRASRGVQRSVCPVEPMMAAAARSPTPEKDPLAMDSDSDTESEKEYDRESLKSELETDKECDEEPLKTKPEPASAPAPAPDSAPAQHAAPKRMQRFQVPVKFPPHIQYLWDQQQKTTNLWMRRQAEQIALLSSRKKNLLQKVKRFRAQVYRRNQRIDALQQYIRRLTALLKDPTPDTANIPDMTHVLDAPHSPDVTHCPDSKQATNYNNYNELPSDKKLPDEEDEDTPRIQVVSCGRRRVQVAGRSSTVRVPASVPTPARTPASVPAPAWALASVPAPARTPASVPEPARTPASIPGPVRLRASVRLPSVRVSASVPAPVSGSQRTSDTPREDALVIQVDGQHDTVRLPRLVRHRAARRLAARVPQHVRHDKSLAVSNTP